MRRLWVLIVFCGCDRAGPPPCERLRPSLLADVRSEIEQMDFTSKRPTEVKDAAATSVVDAVISTCTTLKLTMPQIDCLLAGRSPQRECGIDGEQTERISNARDDAWTRAFGRDPGLDELEEFQRRMDAQRRRAP